MFLEIFIQMLPYLAVFAVLGYIGRIQQKKAKEREEEQKKGIIRTCYVLKTEKILTIFFIVAVVLFGGATVLSALQQKDLLPPVGFGIFFIIALIGTVNMIMWKLEVNEMKLHGVQHLVKREPFILKTLHIVKEKKVLFECM